uniref:Peroxidase 25 n=1 Tax=Anthurium amnicola TaxID=1678845 RepID=A0A1D1XSX3_9ARAE
MDRDLLVQLRSRCPEGGDSQSQRVALDEDTPGVFDVSFFKKVREGRGVLESDQRLWGDDSTRDLVNRYASSLRGLLGRRFRYDFPRSMLKLSSLGVKTGDDGEIRSVCSTVNSFTYQKTP